MVPDYRMSGTCTVDQFRFQVHSLSWALVWGIFICYLLQSLIRAIFAFEIPSGVLLSVWQMALLYT